MKLRSLSAAMVLLSSLAMPFATDESSPNVKIKDDSVVIKEKTRPVRRALEESEEMEARTCQMADLIRPSIDAGFLEPGKPHDPEAPPYEPGLTGGQTFDRPETVIVRSGELQLRALLMRRRGKGPFPAVLFNHGRGLTPQTSGRVENINQLARVFANHGYVFMALFRRGEDLSADHGVFIGKLLDQERLANGEAAAIRLQVRLLESDQLDDVLAGLVFLRKVPEVDGRRVAVVGHSFGGSLSLLAAERDKSLRAVVSFAAAAGSWDSSIDLRERLMAAVGRLTAPVSFIYAANDLSIVPGKALDAEMTRLSRKHQLLLFPPFGKTAEEGHAFVFLGVAGWERDVFSFLDEHMQP